MINNTPILILNSDITSLFCDPLTNSVLIGTKDGKILKMDNLIINAYITGERSVYAQVKDGFGNISELGWNNLFYRIKDQILKVNEDKEIDEKSSKQYVFSANIAKNLNGIFTSPILYGGDDFISWKTMEWKQSVNDDMGVEIYVRVGNTTDKVEKENWTFLKKYDTSTVTQSLDDFNNLGKYIQFKIVLSTNIYNMSPSTYDLKIFYRRASGVYFFTKKYSLTKDSNLESILLTANISQPLYTEIKFGICGEESAEWNDYFPVEIDKITEIPADIRDRLKIGIKFLSFTNDYPVVDEFAVMLKSSKDNLLN